MIARTAAALCVAGRWVGAASLLLTAGALMQLPTYGAAHRIVLTAILVAGAGQAYLSFRVELDRLIFEAAANDTAALERFDAARAAIGLGRRAVGRTPEQRAAGLWRLLKASGVVLALQFALAIASVWAAP